MIKPKHLGAFPKHKEGKEPHSPCGESSTGCWGMWSDTELEVDEVKKKKQDMG